MDQDQKKLGNLGQEFSGDFGSNKTRSNKIKNIITSKRQPIWTAAKKIFVLEILSPDISTDILPDISTILPGNYIFLPDISTILPDNYKIARHF